MTFRLIPSQLNELLCGADLIKATELVDAIAV
jgi:hypothetical protein